jgi:hypothetical protein
MQNKLLDKLELRGVVSFSNFSIDTPHAQLIHDMLETDVTPEQHELLTNELRKLCAVRTLTKKNLVVLTGREVLARLLAGDTTYTGAINYGLLGTGSTAVNAADTGLETEVFRKLFSRRVRTAASVKFDFFFSKASVDGTFEEFGTVIDGTETIDTGVLYNRVLTGGWTKSTSEAMTVEVTLSVTA